MPLIVAICLFRVKEPTCGYWLWGLNKPCSEFRSEISMAKASEEHGQ